MFHLYDSQGNEYFQRKSYLTALREYNVSVLSAPSADDSGGTCQHSAAETGLVDGGKPESDTGTSVSNDTAKPVDDNTENCLPNIAAKDETSSNVAQKSAGDGVKEVKASNKNELALAFANRFEIVVISQQNYRAWTPCIIAVNELSASWW